MAEPSTMNNNNNNNTTSVKKNKSLNDFPDHILLHILSFLPTTRHTIRTTSVSRKWRNLCLSIPSLNFSYRSFSPITIYPDPETLLPFVNFVEQTLIRRPPNSSLHHFKLQFDFTNNGFASHIASWIRFAVSHDAEILDFDLVDTAHALSFFRNIENRLLFEFHFQELKDSLVRVLKLSGCNLLLPRSNTTRFLSLRSVSLKNTVMTDKMVEDLMVACANVESLLLSSVRGCKDIKICSSKLRELTLEHFNCDQGSVEIVTPNLCALSIHCFYVGNYALRDASSLVKASVNLLYCCWIKVMRLLGHVKHLSSNNCFFELLESKAIISESFILQNLKYVELQTSYTESDMMGIAQLLVLSPNLQTLILANDPIFIPQLYDESISEDFIRQLSFNMPSLRHIKMKSFKGTNCEKNLIIVLLKTAVILERIVIIPAEEGQETPESPIILNDFQDFECFVRLYPKHKTFEKMYQHLAA